MSLTNAIVTQIKQKLTPLNAKETRSRHGVSQPATPFKLKNLSNSDFVPNAKTKPADEHAKLTEQAQKLVAQAFYGAMLKEMHKSPFKAKWLDGGRGGEAFQPIADQKYIDHLAKSSSGQKLTRSIVRKMERGRAYAKAQRDAQQINQAKTNSEEPASNPGNHVAPGTRA